MPALGGVGRRRRPLPLLVAAVSVVACLALTFGPALLLLAPLIVLTAWARVIFGDHTPAQALAGTTLGAAGAAAVYATLR